MKRGAIVHEEAAIINYEYQPIINCRVRIISYNETHFVNKAVGQMSSYDDISIRDRSSCEHLSTCFAIFAARFSDKSLL
jgi:hypothetical protein